MIGLLYAATVQNDSLKEFHGQKTFALGPEPSLKLNHRHRGVLHGTRAQLVHHLHIRLPHTGERVRTRCRSWPFTIAQGMAYVESALARGMPVDSFAPRLSFFFGVHNDLFEEIAKFRAARRMWARVMKERYGATRPRIHADALPQPKPSARR